MLSNHRRVLASVVVVIVAGFGLAGCGGGESNDAKSSDPSVDQNADDGTNADEGDEWPPEEMSGSGEAGNVTVDGTEYPIDAVRLCDLADFDAGDDRTREFEVQGTGPTELDTDFPEPFELSVFTGTSRNNDSLGIEWDGPEGLYDGSESGKDLPVEVGDDRITGDMTLMSHLGNPAVDITVDMAVPDGELMNCHN